MLYVSGQHHKLVRELIDILQEQVCMKCLLAAEMLINATLFLRKFGII